MQPTETPPGGPAATEAVHVRNGARSTPSPHSERGAPSFLNSARRNARRARLNGSNRLAATSPPPGCMHAWRLGLASPSLPGVLGAARWRPLVKTMCSRASPTHTRAHRQGSGWLRGWSFLPARGRRRDAKPPRGVPGGGLAYWRRVRSHGLVGSETLATLERTPNPFVRPRNVTSSPPASHEAPGPMVELLTNVPREDRLAGCGQMPISGRATLHPD